MSFAFFDFTKSWRNSSDFPTYERSETKVREDMQSLFDELKNGLNTLIGSLFAANVPFEPTAGVEADNVQAAIEDVQGQLAGVVLDQIPDNTVTGAKLTEGAVGTAKLASGAVTAEKLAAGAVGTAKLASGAVTAEKLADGAVSSVYTLTLDTENWQSYAEELVYKSVSVPGVSASDRLFARLDTRGQFIGMKFAAATAWRKLMSMEPGENKVSFYFLSAPENSMQLELTTLKK